MAKIAIAVYSTYGHILSLAKAEVEGAKSTGNEVDLFQLPSGEPNDASASSDLPVLTPSKLEEYDGVLFGIPSRFGTFPYAFKAFFDATGGQWASAAYYGKYAGLFVTSGTQGGGQESVIRNSVTILTHHGFLYVPLGYANAFGNLTNLEEVHGGSPWGAGSFAGPSGARQPSELELDTAKTQGRTFAELVAKAFSAKTGTTTGTAAGLAGATAAGATATGATATGATATGATATAATGAETSAKSAEKGAKGGETGAPSAGATGAPTSASTAPSAGVAGVTSEGTESKSGIPESKTEAEKEVSSAAGAVSAKADGVDATAADAKDEVSNEAADTEKEAKNSVPAKGDVKEGAKTAEKESEGCCKCM